MYYSGIGTEVNHEKAVYWYEKAAEQGDAEAQYYLGDMYYKGEGTAADLKQALVWMEKAAEQGYELAKGFLQKYKNDIK